jgi:hypothetical protein
MIEGSTIHYGTGSSLNGGGSSASQAQVEINEKKD